MKVLLSMPIGVMKESPTLFGRNQPLGLMYIASFLEKAGHEVKIIDTVVDKSRKKYIRILKRFNPDMVGISSVTPTIYAAWDTAKLVKKETSSKVFLGGDHVTFLPGETLFCCKDVDYVVRGEGEITTLELMKHVQGKSKIRNIKGVSYRNKNEIIHNPPRPWIKDLDSLPFPAWHLVNMYKYTSIVGRSSTLISSRGCPQGCHFCLSSRKCGLAWRPRSAESVVSEMTELMERYPRLDNLISIDDNMMWDIKRLERICDLLIKSKSNIEWFCQGRADTINMGGRNLLKKMKKAGCRGIQIGIESPYAHRLKEIGKGIREGEGYRAARITEDLGILVRATYLFGFENQSKSEIEETLRFAKKLNTAFIQVGIMTPFPGTPFFERIKNRLNTHDWRRFTIMHEFLHYDFDVEREISKIFLLYHLRPSYIWKTMKYGLNKSWTAKTIIYPLIKIMTGSGYDYLYSFEPNEWMKKSEQYWERFILRKNLSFENSWYFKYPKKEGNTLPQIPSGDGPIPYPHSSP